MAETPPNVINLAGATPDLPKLPNVQLPVYQAGGVGARPQGDIYDAYAAALRAVPGGGMANVPLSSFHTGNRYPSSRPYRDVEEMAAQQQSGWDQVANGLLKGAGIIGTSFISGTAGLLNGIFQMSMDGKLSSLFNNPVNNITDSVNKELEDILPNYKTKAEVDADWYSPTYLINPNTLGDDIFKNLGYAGGMLASGKVWTNILKNITLGNELIKAGQGLETATAMEQAIANAPKVSRFGAVSETLSSLSQKYLRQPAAKLLTQGDRLTTSVLGMFGEAGLESLQGMNEFRDKLIEEYVLKNGARPEGEDLNEINEYAESVGKYIYGFNAVVLSASNYVQLPKILNSSKNIERAFINDIERQAGKPLGDFIKSPSNLEKAFGRVGRITDSYFVKPVSALFAPSEALEEGAQFAVQSGVQNYFERAYENPDETTSFFSSIGKALNVMDEAVEKTLTTDEGMKNLLIGGISGGLMTIPHSVASNRARARNTDIAVQSLNATKIPQVLKDMAAYTARGINSQKRRAEAILDDDTLTEKNEKANYLFSYLMPRIKYGKTASVTQELDWYRKQASTDTGFNELIDAGIVNAGETREEFFLRLADIQQRADALEKTYTAISDKYSRIYDKENKRVYDDSVIDKMAYASSKIVDYDERLVGLQTKLEANGVQAFKLKEALSQSAAWKEGRMKDAVREEAVTKAITDIVADIEEKDIVDDAKRDLKNDFSDYIELALQRKDMMENYNEMLNDPMQFSDSKNITKFDLEESQEPIEVTPNLIVTPGDKFVVGNSIEYDEEGNKTERAKEVTILKETDDGKIAVANEKGIVELIDPDKLEDYMLQKADAEATATSKFFRNLNGKRFQYNFGPKSGVREGRLQYNPSTDTLYFITDDGKRPLRRRVDASYFAPVEDGGKGRVALVTTGSETADQMNAFSEYTSPLNVNKDKERGDLVNTKDERADIISQLYDTAKTRLEEVRKQISDKREKLLNIGSRIKLLRASDRSAYSKVVSTATSAYNSLLALAKHGKQELEALKKEQAQLEFNLEYFQQMKDDVASLPNQPEALVNELNKQVGWIDDIAKSYDKQVKRYESVLDKVKKVLADLTSFLKNATQRFDSKYPSYIKDSFNRMIEGGDILAEIPIVKEYLADYALLEDTKRDIAIDIDQVKRLEGSMKDVTDELDDINKERIALNKVLDEFKQVVARHKAAKEAEEKLRQNEAFQSEMETQQKGNTPDSGAPVSDPPTPDDFEKEQEDADMEDARKYVHITWASTVNSSTVRKASVIRHDQFMEKIDSFPAKVRSKLRRIFVTENNEAALGLTGIIKKYQDGYTPPAGEETILAVYVAIEGNKFSYVDVNGKPIFKPTDENIDLDKIVFTTMPAPNEELAGYGPRYNKKATRRQIDAYLGAWKRVRERLLGMVDRTFPPEEFYVSRGVLYKSKDKSHIVGNLVSTEQFESGVPVVVVATADSIIHQTIEVPTKRGRVYVQNGGTFQQVNTRNINKAEVDTIFEVLKEFVKKATVDKVWDPKLTKFLQGILYFQSPFEKEGEGGEVKKAVSRNQMYFRKGNFYMGASETPIPFSVSGLIDNEAVVKDFLSKTYHHVNNAFLKNNGPFTSYALDEQGNLQPKTWKNYQAYLISPEGRTAIEAPLHTNARRVSSDVAEDARFLPGSRYTYSNNLLEVSADDLKEAAVVAPISPELTPQAGTAASTEALLAEEDDSSPFARAIAALKKEQQKASAQKAAAETAKPAEFTRAPTEETPTPEPQAGSANFVNPAVRAEQNEPIGDNAKIEVTEQFNPEETPGETLKDMQAKVQRKQRDMGKKRFRLIPMFSAFDYAVADVNAEKQYIEKNTPFKVETIKALIAAGNGLYAFGSYLNGVIELSDRMEIGTGYHEMFEGIFDVFLSPKEKRKLFNEFARREGTFVDRETGKTVKYKDATAHQAIEEMAEEFRRFKLYQTTPPKAKTSFIREFFETLMTWIESIFNNDIKNLTDLFAKMDAGKYSNAAYRDAPSLNRRFREKIGTLSVQQAQVIVDNVVSRVFQTLTYQGRADILNSLDFSTFSATEIYDEIFDELEQHFVYDLPEDLKATQGVTEAEYNKLILPVWVSIQNNWGLVRQYANEMLKTFNIVQKETDQDNIQQESSNEDESSSYAGNKSDEGYLQDAYMYDARTNAPASIKIAIATIQESLFIAAEDGLVKIGELSRDDRQIENERDQTTGLEVMVNFAKMFNRLLVKLHGANTLKQKEAIVDSMANSNPNFFKLYNRLKMGQMSGLTLDDWALKVKAYTTFAKQQTNGIIVYNQPDGTSSLGDSNLHDSIKRAINQWFSKFQKNDKLVKYSKDVKMFQFDGRALLAQGISTVEGQYKFLNELGIYFSPVQMANVSNDQQEKIQKAISNIKGVIRAKGILDASSLKTLDITGNLRPIFEVYAETQSQEPESTYTNMDGERSPSYLQPNTFSRVINDINAAQTKEELLQEVPILRNPYSQDSVILNKIFDDEGDKVGSEASGVEDFKQGLFVEGTLDTETNEGITTDKMQEAPRLMQSITLNLGGYYYILIPAEGKREHMLNMPNLYENLEAALTQMWNYYQTEVRLGGTEGRFFNFLDNDLTREQFDKEFTAFVEREIDSQFNQLSDYKIIEQNPPADETDPITYKWTGLPKSFLSRAYRHTQLSEEQIREILAFRTVNFFANNVEMMKMFFGDPKDISDPTKRIKSWGSPTEQALYDVPELDAELNATYNTVAGVQLQPGDPGYHVHKNSLTTVTLEDNYTENKYLLENREALKIGDNYGMNNTTDAQAVTTLTGFRHMQIKNGYRWNAKAQEQLEFEMARDRLAMEEDGYFSYEGRESLRTHDEALVKKGDPRSATFVPLKPKVSGYYGTSAILDKYSIAPITYFGVRGKTLATQYVRMLKNGVDYTIFESGRKIGATDMDSYYIKEGEDIGKPNMAPYKDTAMIEVPFKWFGIQTETQTSKTTSTIGSQVSKEATLNTLDAGVPRDVQMSFDEWTALSEADKEAKSDVYKKVRAEKAAREALSDWGFDYAMKRLGLREDGTVDAQKVLDLIVDQLERRQINNNIRSALKIDPETKTFRIPLETLNNYTEIKSVLFAFIDKAISSGKVNGGSRVQVSASGFETAGRRVVAKKIKNKKGKEITVWVSDGLKSYTKENPYCEALIPFIYGEKLKKAGIDISDAEVLRKLSTTEEGKKILRGVGFRIPTQELNSMEAFIIVGFLPESYGNMIVLPEELTTKSGGDFDVDKLITYLKNVYVDGKGELRLVPFMGYGQEGRKAIGEMWDRGEFLKPKDRQELDRIIEEERDAMSDEDVYTKLLMGVDGIAALFSEEQITKEFMSLRDKGDFREYAIDTLYKQSIENQYFQTVEDLITMEMNFERLIAPNSAQELKDIRDRLVAVSEEEFGDGLIKSLGSPTYMNRQRHNFLLSKGGVSIPASNQTSHAMMQKVPMILDPEAIKDLEDVNEKKYVKDASFKLPTDKITVKGKEYSTLSRVFDKAGRYISAKISQYVDGFVDVIKDPFLVQMGVNKGNAGIFLFLERMQVPSNIVAMFMNQPIIREFNKILAKNGTTYPYSDLYINEAKAFFPTSKSVDNYKNPGDLAKLDEELMANIQKYYGDKEMKFTDEEAAYQHFILEEYLKYAVMASNLFRANQALNYDTSSFSNPYMLDKKLRDTKAAVTNNLFRSVEDILDNTFMGKVKDNLEKAFGNVSRNLFKFLADDVKEYIYPAIRQVMDKRGMSQRDKLTLVRRVEQSFISYLVQHANNLQSYMDSLLINEDTALAGKEFQELVAKVMDSPFSPLAKNLVLTTLGTEDIKEPMDTKVMRFYERTRDVRSQDQYIAAMEEIRDNPITADFYKKLVRAAFIQSGISTSPISFTDVIPVEDFMPYISKALDSLSDKSLLADFIASDSFYKNNWKNRKLVPRLYGKKVRDFVATRSGANVKNFAAKTGIDVRMYKVYTAAKEWNNPFLAIEQGSKEERKTLLLKKLEVNGEPVLFKDTIKSKDAMGNPVQKELYYGVFVGTNAWGDGEKAEEFYRSPRKSKFNNKTIQFNQELTPTELLFIIKNQMNVVDPAQPALLPTQTDQATIGEADPEIPRGTVVGTETEPYIPSDAPNSFTFKDGTVVATPFKLNSQQQDALLRLEEFYKNPSKTGGRITLSGYAGTGKTSIIAIFDKYLKTKFSFPYYTAPTHRANAVTKQNNPEARVMTLHSLFGLTPNFDVESGDYSIEDLEYAQQNEPKVTEGALVIVDEASMVSTALYEFLRKSMEDDGISVIFVGDSAQLKPVGEDNISPVFSEGEVIQLTKVERTGDNPVLEESTNLREGKDFSYETKQVGEEGVEYVKGEAATRKIIGENFGSEEFKRNKLAFRILAAKNKDVKRMNDLVRDTLYNTKAQLVAGEVLMGYHNWNEDYETKEPRIINGGDYQVTSFTETTKKVKIGKEEISFKGYDSVLKNLLNPKDSPKRVFIVDNSEPDEKILIFVNEIARLRREGALLNKSRNKSDKVLAAQMFAAARKLEGEIAFMKHLADANGKFKVKKTLDYGYAHTIHKSQGGTYGKVMILASTIDNAFDAQTQQQLKYVSMSRASKFAYVVDRPSAAGARAVKKAAVERPGAPEKVEGTKVTAQVSIADLFAKPAEPQAEKTPFERALAAAEENRKKMQQAAQPVTTGKVVADIPQNKVSGIESYGSTVTANAAAITALGPRPHSIDMIEAGFRTRTTRSASEMEKYKVKVGDTIKHFGKSADGTTKTVFATVTAIHPKGSPGWKGTWEKEGWRAEDVNVIDRFKDGAAAIEFQVKQEAPVVAPTVISTPTEVKPEIQQGKASDEEIMKSEGFLKFIENMPPWVDINYALENYKKCNL